MYAPADGYRESLLRRDMSAPYRTLTRLLTTLRDPRRTLELKNPGHLSRLPLLARAWPALQVVWMHRDPVPAFASFCGLVASSRRLFGSRVDLTRIGPEWLEVWRHHGAAAASARVGLDVIDVDYERLAADPVRTSTEVAGRLGLPEEDGDGARVAAAMARMKANPHRWRLEPFGVSADDVLRALAMPPPGSEYLG